VIIRVPASSANLGPGFDALGVALGLHLELLVGDVLGDVLSDGPRPTEEEHPAVRAFRQLGCEGDVHVRSGIAMGRGLGFSGAARVAGLVGALAQQKGDEFVPLDAADEILHVATALEGHADNVAPSLHGGVVASAGGRAVRVPLAIEPLVVVWIPSSTTSTDHSRRALPATVSLTDAVFNIGRTALLVAALAAGDVNALRTATEDRLHQDRRFEEALPSRRALSTGLEAGAWCGWLSGSGPTIALLCAPHDADALAAALPDDGHTKVLPIDAGGAAIVRC
jgi:homoserine kinase